MIPPTFHNPLVEQLVNAFFQPGEERDYITKGGPSSSAMLPTSQESLTLKKTTLGLMKERLAKAEQEVRDYEAIIALAEVIFAITDGAEDDKLVDWHGQ
jgi:hypothetical protein